MIFSNSLILFFITNIIIISIFQFVFVKCIGSNLNHNSIDVDPEEVFVPDYLKEISNDKRISEIEREKNLRWLTEDFLFFLEKKRKSR